MAVDEVGDAAALKEEQRYEIRTQKLDRLLPFDVSQVIIEAHRHEGVFIARAKEDSLVTLNSTPGKDVYGEKRIQVENPTPGSPIKRMAYGSSPWK